MRIEEGFQQTPYEEEHPYRQDPVLSSLLKRLIPANLLPEIEQDLVRFGNDLVSEIRPSLAPVTPPTLVQYDQLGRRVDKLQTSETWKILEDLSIREGLVSIGYERDKYGPAARVFMFAKCMMSVGDFNVVGCPFAMTDGAARVLELYGSNEMKQAVIPRLLSRDPSSAYLGGQWMTERPGGSDVSQTETVAHQAEHAHEGQKDLGPPYILNGFKWFSSAAEGHLSVALARTGSPSSGSRGLSLFLVPIRMKELGNTTSHTVSPLTNGIFIHRLKNKFGTIGLPTAELSLSNTRGWLIGREGEGVRLISPVLNITRVHSAVNCLGSLQRGLSIARSYARVRRIASGTQLLVDTPLHMQTLANISLIYRGLSHLVFGVIDLLGKVECGIASESEALRLRMLTPAVKAYTASMVPELLLECMAALGGLGYMEETGIGRLVRDATVEKIWEGTFNILALDVQRAGARDPKVIQAFVSWANGLLKRGGAIPSLKAPIDVLQPIMARLAVRFEQSTLNPLLPGMFLTLFSTVSTALYLLEHTLWSIEQHDVDAQVNIESLTRWVSLDRRGGSIGVLGDLTMLVKHFDHLVIVAKDHTAPNGQLSSHTDLKLVYGGGKKIGNAKL